MPLPIPTDAPFSDTQRMWLKGFFAGLGLSAPDNGSTDVFAPTSTGEPLAILWGSQTGNAEAFAKQLAKKAKAAGLTPTIHDMSTVDRATLSALGNVAILTSTYGDGEPPDNAAALHSFVMKEDQMLLAGVRYSVFALGDSNYPAFCQCGRDFDTRLEQLGATRVSPRVEADCDYDTPFNHWSENLLGALAGEPAAA
ncbi:MAG: flavodoxin domain-containing protein [Luteolibacter sp.]